MAFRIDTSALYRQPAPSAPSGIGSVLDTIMQRRHQMELQKQQQEAQAAQAKADREAQQAHWNQIDARERDRYAAEDKRYQQKTRAEMTGALVEDYAKNQGRGAGLLAEGYGFKMAPEMEAATPDPRAPAMADIDEDPSAAPVQAKPTGRQMLSRDGESFAFAPPQADDPTAYFEALEQQIMTSVPPSPMREIELRRVREAKAAKLSGKDSLEYLEKERNRNAANLRAAMQARAGMGIKPSQAADDARADSTLANTILNQSLTREDYRDVLTNARDTKLMLEGLESDNPAAQKRSLGIWAKQASGPGAVQQSERDEFVNMIGGMDEKLKASALRWLSSGEAPPEQRKIFAEAAKNIIQRRQQETLQTIQQDVAGQFARHPNPRMRAYSDWAADSLSSEFLPRKRKQEKGEAPKSIRRLEPADEDRMKRAGF